MSDIINVLDIVRLILHGKSIKLNIMKNFY
jgi:hypothetical protein